MDAVSQFERRVWWSLAVLLFLAAASWPAWGIRRPDRVWGLALGIAASVARLLWTFLLARRFETMTRTRYAAGRLLGLVALAAALAVAGSVKGIDLYAAAFGVLFATGASIAAAVLELRAVERQDRAALDASEPPAEQATRCGRP